MVPMPCDSERKVQVSQWLLEPAAQPPDFEMGLTDRAVDGQATAAYF